MGRQAGRTDQALQWDLWIEVVTVAIADEEPAKKARPDGGGFS
jgi:hypothetical protein